MSPSSTIVTVVDTLQVRCLNSFAHQLIDIHNIINISKTLSRALEDMEWAQNLCIWDLFYLDLEAT